MKKLLILLTLMGAGAATTPAAAQSSTLTVRSVSSVPSVSLLGLDGQKFSSAAVQPKGKVLVVVYFSPTCSHCIQFTEELTGRLKDFQQVQFLYVSAYPVTDIKNFAAVRGMLKMKNLRLANDPEFKLGSFYELKEIPGIFVYGTNGKLRRSFDSKVKMDELVAATRN
ncbi:MAG: redoxin domain-containing protein [Chitinophagaceae bacterium]|nr:redoxin domain-containing protein [Chitinophagaceae bacterium]